MKNNEKGIAMIHLIIMIVVIFMVLIGIFGISVLKDQNTNVSVNGSAKVADDDNELYSRKKVEDLLKAGNAYNNYQFEIPSEDSVFVIQKYNNHLIRNRDDISIIGQNLDTKEYTVINKEKKLYSKVKEAAEASFYMDVYIKYIQNTNISYEFVGEEKIDSFDCICIRLISPLKEMYEKENADVPNWVLKEGAKLATIECKLTLYIDKETGLVVKEHISNSYKNKVSESELDYKLKVDMLDDSVLDSIDEKIYKDLGYEIKYDN